MLTISKVFLPYRALNGWLFLKLYKRSVGMVMFENKLFNVTCLLSVKV